MKSNTILVEFWSGFQADVNLEQIANQSIPVKGESYDNPLRFLEIFANLPSKSNKESEHFNWKVIQKNFIPKIPNVDFVLGENNLQPPFTWKECSPYALSINFTYGVNAIYRILSNLNKLGHIPSEELDNLIDMSCIRLAHIYRARNSFIMRNMNNNFNMFLIPRVVESIVGNSIYKSDLQEYSTTQQSLQVALKLAEGYVNLDIYHKIEIALGKGVAFIEKRLNKQGLSKSAQIDVETTAFRYFESSLAIDDRSVLLDKIANAASTNNHITMTTILDDAAETVDDLLWILELMEKFPFFHVKLLVNTAQVSINFSIHMLKDVLSSSIFNGLGNSIDKQFQIIKIYCPFISFQMSAMPPVALQAINDADFVFVKGMNFFETLQIKEKDTFYAFIVFGPISKIYTGLENYDAVFAYVPAGQTGYIHNQDPTKISTLKDIKNCYPRYQAMKKNSRAKSPITLMRQVKLSEEAMKGYSFEY